MLLCGVLLPPAVVDILSLPSSLVFFSAIFGVPSVVYISDMAGVPSVLASGTTNMLHLPIRSNDTGASACTLPSEYLHQFLKKKLK
jgi:hypothetical protein